MDVLYFLREGPNEELRLSLRSLTAHFPHETVWVVGDKPDWLTNVEFIKGNRRNGKWHNVYDNLRIACRKVKADRFVVMNDDFFITEPVKRLPSWHRGPLTEHIAMAGKGQWGQSLLNTLKFLRQYGFEDPLSYELHVPVVMERAKLGEVLRKAVSGRDVPPQWRTLYGNWWHVKSTRAPDVKARYWSELASTRFISTSDRVFAQTEAGRRLREMFPDRSPYERRH